jgi:protein SCO1/2
VDTRIGVLILATTSLVLAGCVAPGSASGPASQSASQSASRPKPPGPSVGTRLDRTIPPAVGAAPLIDADGRSTSLNAWRGRVVVLTDMLTLCQEICPLTSANYRQLAAAVRSAGRTDKVEFIELTVDPKRDTPGRLQAYRRLVGSAPNWELLTAAPSTIAKLWRYFGVSYQVTPATDQAARDWWTHRLLTYDVDHNDVVVFLDRKGHERFLINAAPNTQGRRPPPTLTRMLDAEGHRNLDHPATTAWTVPQALRAVSWLIGERIVAE